MRSKRVPALAGLMCVVLTLTACGGGGSAEGAAGGAGGDTQGATLPANLQGQWQVVLAYVPPFYGGPVDEVPDGDGALSATFAFAPDGQYRHEWRASQVYFNGLCFFSGHWEETGVATAVGSEITFTPGHAVYVQMDSCGQAQYLDPAPVTAATRPFAVGQDATGTPTLRVHFESGDLVLQKCQDCG